MRIQARGSTVSCVANYWYGVFRIYLLPAGDTADSPNGIAIDNSAEVEAAFLEARTQLPRGFREYYGLRLPRIGWTKARSGTIRVGLILPAWTVILALSMPAAMLWYLDRRRPAPGACRCGYDLTGNTSGRCPECGQVVERAA